MRVKTEAPKLYSYLKGEQAAASSPDADIWLSASAGTGKTFVLAARVVRLLLRPGVRPDSILCLTFTRAGAAEMAHRVHSRLSMWARLDDARLRGELTALGEDNSPAAVAHARTLFAEVLDSRGGGLRVMTIHAFCQTLLGTFPLEAGLTPGFRAIEGREQSALAANVLAALADTAEQDGDTRLTAALAALSMRLGEDGTRRFLLRAAKHVDALEALTDGLEAKVRRAMDVSADFHPDDVGDACCDDRVDRAALIELISMHKAWDTKTGDAAMDTISNWLLGSPAQRGAELDSLALVWGTKEGVLRKNGPKHPGHGELVARLHSWCASLQALRARAELADDIAHALHAARRYARAYADAKQQGGFVDFDDLIGKAVTLLTTPGMGAWIAYKLDQATDHVLIDEAQDTNIAQWNIVRAVVGEFWADDPQATDRIRTLFSVGDYKQAIFGFQGTDPRHYADAGNEFDVAARTAGRTLTRLSLDRSFRSTPPVLDIVDALLAELGDGALGTDVSGSHESARGGPGSVTLLAPLRPPAAEDIDGEEAWVANATRHLASTLAKQVRRWLDDGHVLAASGRRLTAGDIMILVRKRSDLAALLVARLQAEKVPVAGIDRLRLGAPLAVKDCLAAMRFAVQPDDDLTLAALLVSPICGWTQDQLYLAAHVRRSGSLWRHLREHHAEAIAVLRALLAMADFVSPHVFLETMLSGAIGARRALLRRLGNDAGDAIDELTNAALQYAGEGVATLQGFLDWFDRSDGEIVRDAGRGDAVRVMTVHAAKGLQAPLVILADATADPDAAVDRDFEWVLDDALVPLFRPRNRERALQAGLEAMASHLSDQDRREHWRLLYVAMTRAEEQLVVAGALDARKPTAPEASWHAAIERAMMTKGATVTSDPNWGEVRIHAAGGRTAPAAAVVCTEAAPTERPVWLDRPAPEEARPVRPLAPSSLGVDRVADPPPSSDRLAAAARGRLLHALFERLPPIARSERRTAGERWLAGAAGVADAPTRTALIDDVLAVIDLPELAWLFEGDGLAEVPIAGVVDDVVVSGTIDRLVVGTDSIALVDFKTQRRVPANAAGVPDAHLRQMAAYAAVLRGVFPDHTIRASLLYTSGPRLFVLSNAQLAAHKPRLADAEPIFAPTVEHDADRP